MSSTKKRRADLLTRTEAAEYIGVSRAWLGNHRDESEGGPRRLRIGGKLFYLQGDLDKFIDSGGSKGWGSTREAEAASGGPGSNTAGGRFGGQQAKATRDRLRSKLEKLGSKSKRPNLHLVADSTE